VKRRVLIHGAVSAALCLPITAGAQQSVKGAPIGARELGYVEGQTINLLYRRAEGREDRLQDLAVDLVRLEIDAFVASGYGPVATVKRATTTFPIVTPC